MVKVYAYGDESYGPSAISYGMLLVPKPLIAKLEHRFSLTKLAFGGRIWDEVHCNQLMNSADKARGPWSHLGYEDVFALFERICGDCVELGTQQVACVFDKNLGPELDKAFAQPWVDADGNEQEPSVEQVVPPGDKGIAVLCALALMRAALDGVAPSPLTFIPDPDRDSRIEWLTEIRKVPEILERGTFDTRGRFRYVKVRPPKPALLQIADLIAYAAQKARRDSQSETTKRFKALTARMITSTYNFQP